VLVQKIESGYKASQLAEASPDPGGALAVHRAFRTLWANDG